MRVKVKKTVSIKGTPYEAGREYDVDEGLGKWMLEHDIAEELKALPVVSKPVSYVTAYDRLVELTEFHLAEIYGGYGTGKSRLVHHIAVEAQNMGKRVLFIDSEGGLKDEHVRQLKNYWYVGDSIEALEDAVATARMHRKDYDLLVVDSCGHPVYVNYVELETMADKLRAYQRLALIFRDMVRFARGEKDENLGERKALAIVTNHTVSEFSRIAKELPPEEPLDPFGGQIHRVPKVILRAEPAEITPERSVFKLLSFKLRDMPKNVEIARYTIDYQGVWVEWLPTPVQASNPDPLRRIHEAAERMGLKKTF
jgi:KaiC/GvpD/RAD55 family RecA-like ATPase